MARAETHALRGRGRSSAFDEASESKKRVGVAVGVAIVFGVAAASCWASYLAGSPLMTTNLSASHALLRGQGFTPDDENNPPHANEGPPRAWKILDDPQPGPPVGIADEPVPNGRTNLKHLLLAQFGLDKSALSEPVESPDALRSNGAIVPPKDGGEEVPPQLGPEDLRDAKMELKEMLLERFGLEDPAKPHDEVTQAKAELSPTQEEPLDEPKHRLRVGLRDALKLRLQNQLNLPESRISHGDSDSWNWLQPAEESFAQVKDADQEAVRISSVLEHLKQQRAVRALDLVVRLHEVDAQFNRTRECFARGTHSLSNPEMSRLEYERVIEWMGDNCAVGDDQQTVNTTHTTTTPSMTKAEFKASIAKQFELVLNASTKGVRHAKMASSRAEAAKREIATCIDRAAERAADAASGRIHESTIDASIDWIVNHCITIE